MEIHIELGPHGHRWAWTEGLSAYNQQDFAAPMPWEEGNWRDDQLRRLLEFLESYMQVQPKRIHADETMRYGWTSLYFRAAQREDGTVGGGRLIICEVAEPLRDVEPQYVDGAQRAIMLKMHQGYTAYRLGINEVDHPHRSMSAIVCKRLPHSGATHFFMSRSARTSDEEHLRDSGWFFGCTDDTHAHDNADEHASVHLLHLVEHYPFVFTYLALPDETMVAFEDGAVRVFKPRTTEPVLDTEKPFTGLRDGPLH